MAETYGRAREAVERALALERDLAEGLAEMGWIRTTCDWDPRNAEASFARALELAPGNAAIAKYSDMAAAQVAEVHAARGEADAAFEWLDRAFMQRDAGVLELSVGPDARSLRSDPRWVAFMKRMGLEADVHGSPPRTTMLRPSDG